jgi:hypothetical protein
MPRKSSSVGSAQSTELSRTGNQSVDIFWNYPPHRELSHVPRVQDDATTVLDVYESWCNCVATKKTVG